MQKQHCQSPKGRRERVVAVSKKDAHAQHGHGEHVEVDLLLLTCKQDWENGQGCMQGKHGDELDMLGLVIHALLMSW